MPPRAAVWEILKAVAKGAFTDVAIAKTFRKYKLSVVDKALATELACGSIRQRQTLDSWIDHLGKVPSHKQPPLLRWLLHLGLYQIFYMDRIPVSAAVNTTVELAKRKGLGRLAPVVNAILRKAVKARNSGDELPLCDGTVARLAQKHSIPKWMAEKLMEWKGEEGAEIIAQAFNQTPTIDLRINGRCSSIHSIQKKFRDVGIESNCIQRCSQGLSISSGIREIREWPGYKEGEWSVQDRSAQWVAPLLEAKPGESVLDACAAPGGKTTHVAELIDDIGEIWAVDSSPKRLKLTIANTTRLGLQSIHFLSADSTNLLNQMPSWKNYFQRILLDAPCSGLGTLARNPDARWRITPSKIEELVLLQVRLFDGIIPLLKSGGRIVYSTCTIHPDENFKQVENIISRYDQLILRDQKQIWPGEVEGGDGFYAAIIDSL
ncbi:MULTISPECIES: 16S rRNA (cytosine(967)-C(5))-methyltransferase [unclassified Prochlorococcus]|uniref:16S rRNA (cytosine(967)-C(5))-methyltransferase n=1 Tax=unclassified Prochlorococcus TaxID=2627481 RepID=UPI0005339C4E|nr:MULTISPECIES: 16S rRNA (cytosine(967)-C(5))-methyltransferase [unclassified Prochlorococcus]KGG16536.1 Ribosomal RNA small subunit methyltransferase B [Prochlorococcus sp. MIT 0602]KGG16989.1 Ribosomal RNA small subunit methyltransferase B [Prochlorococcus sp. MIT 0603]